MLSEHADIYVPSKDADGQLLPDRDDLLDWLLVEMGREFGGATATQLTEGRGSYKTADGVVVIEPITIVRSFCADAGSHRARVRALARELKARARQESVAIKTPQGMEFV